VRPQPRVVTAGNGGPFTLEGTRTYLVGDRTVVVIDAGPALDAHMSALREAVAGAEAVIWVVTHGHGDHAPHSPPRWARTSGDPRASRA
jgi:glyoxylase-like metal-dependent hydrolase (beta-lactamase superfamily II)